MLHVPPSPKTQEPMQRTVPKKQAGRANSWLRLAPRCLAGTAASLPTTPLILREAATDLENCTYMQLDAYILFKYPVQERWPLTGEGRPAPLESVDSTLASVTPVRSWQLGSRKGLGQLGLGGRYIFARPGSCFVHLPRYSPSRIEDSYAGLDFAGKAPSGCLA